MRKFYKFYICAVVGAIIELKIIPCIVAGDVLNWNKIRHKGVILASERDWYREFFLQHTD